MMTFNGTRPPAENQLDGVRLQGYSPTGQQAAKKTRISGCGGAVDDPGHVLVRAINLVTTVLARSFGSVLAISKQQMLWRSREVLLHIAYHYTGISMSKS